ncbi:hypothetical protein [Fibrella aquatilis]|uniref:Uncharacterized protein n=1 Tax=Fibrella aquatilis TaxID=2817059 RepID=A0A939JYG7_9BACT|nr:hypothetical protein [Fibrella aquatilis]MBO0930353.1 hypothetical protein [Fibrella aquatilis]
MRKTLKSYVLVVLLFALTVLTFVSVWLGCYAILAWLHLTGAFWLLPVVALCYVATYATVDAVRAWLRGVLPGLFDDDDTNSTTTGGACIHG